MNDFISHILIQIYYCETSTFAVKSDIIWTGKSNDCKFDSNLYYSMNWNCVCTTRIYSVSVCFSCQRYGGTYGDADVEYVKPYSNE